MSQYLQIFIEESKENLQALNENLLLLEATPDDIEVVNVIFRVAHTLKGMAGTMGFVKMQHLTHSVENVLSEIRNGKLHITTELVDIMFQCLDALENYVDQIINTSSEGDESYSNLIGQLEAILKGDFKGGAPAATATDTPAATTSSATNAPAQSNQFKLPDSVEVVKKQALESGMNVLKINIIIAKTCMLKAARAFIVYSDLGTMGEIIHSDPSSQEIEEEKFDQEFMLVLTTDESPERIQEIVMAVAEIEGVTIEEFTLDQQDTPIVQDEEVPEQNVPEAPTPAPAAPPPPPAAPKKAATKEDAAAAHKAAVAGKSVRVNIDRLDTLWRLIKPMYLCQELMQLRRYLVLLHQRSYECC